MSLGLSMGQELRMATMYQLGLVRQATPGALRRNKSAAGAKWVAQRPYYADATSAAASHVRSVGLIAGVARSGLIVAM